MQRFVLPLVGMVVGVALAGHTALSAQDGVSSASVSVARAGLAPRADAVRVEEFVNYHRHDIPQAMGAAVALDLRWGAPACAPQGEAVLQVGLATTRFRIDKSKIPPLNLAIVVDHSGSMAGDRMERVKEALVALVDVLRAEDRVALVGFSTDAHVLLAASSPLDRDELRTAIDTLQADGSTNLHAGLMLGYEQVAASYDAAKTNRVILLTDGLANTGVVDDGEILRQSAAMNKKEVDLSTIGLGSDFNHGLLRSLAQAGRGLLHFVADEQDIKKTFIDEAESLLSPVARRIAVEIVADESLHLMQVHGYGPTVDGQRIAVPLDDLNHGATQVILVRYRAAKSPATDEFGVTVRLRYFDVARRENIVEERRATIACDPQLAADAPAVVEPSVRKNATIAEMAEDLRTMALSVEAEKLDESLAPLDAALALADARYAGDDADIQRMRGIVANYHKAIAAESERLKEAAVLVAP